MLYDLFRAFVVTPKIEQLEGDLFWAKFHLRQALDTLDRNRKSTRHYNTWILSTLAELEKLRRFYQARRAKWAALYSENQRLRAHIRRMEQEINRLI